MSEFNKDKRFDLDLGYGEIFETKLADSFKHSRIEVKTERDKWSKTGNIFIEYKSRGKPSGISTTEAEYYFIFLSFSEPAPRSAVGIMIDTNILKSFLRNLLLKKKRKPVKGGDDMTSVGVLVKISEIFELAKHDK